MNVSDYDIFHVGISGGKDSQALLLWVVNESGFPLDKVKASFCDTGNEHQLTYEHIEMMSNTIHPIETIKPPLDFYELAKKKGRFPSPKARFCTQALKIFPTQKHIMKWMEEDKRVLLLSGVRADESKARSNLVDFEFDTYYACDMYRPLLKWSLDNVLKFLDKYNSPRNPLYDYGARRVGCYPCIMSNKAEIRQIEKQFPERFDMIREKEKELESTFFSPNKVPERFRSKTVETKDGRTVSICTIDDVIDWSKTGYRKPDQYEFDFSDSMVCDSNLGFCE